MHKRVECFESLKFQKKKEKSQNPTTKPYNVQTINNLSYKCFEETRLDNAN